MNCSLLTVLYISRRYFVDVGFIPNGLVLVNVRYANDSLIFPNTQDEIHDLVKSVEGINNTALVYIHTEEQIKCLEVTRST